MLAATPTTQTWLAEFAASAISPAMALANAYWVKGPEAVEAFLEGAIAKRQRVTSYATTGTRNLLDRYAFLEDGGWIAFGNLAGADPIPYIKPASPRWDEDRNRELKYETPPGAQARPLFPSLTLTALRRCCEAEGFDYAAVLLQLQAQAVAIGLAKSEAKALERFTSEIHRDVFWPVWREMGGRSAIAEGWKKAVALTEWGLPAVALRGITQWHPKGVSGLWPELEELATASKLILIAFDQDSKLRTRRDVMTQAQRLGQSIARVSKAPRFLAWDGAQGKGIDDALVALPEAERVAWLEGAIKAALTQKQQRREATLAIARVLRNQTPLPADRLTTGDYLPELPPLTPGAIHCVVASMNSGKTYRIGLDWVSAWRAAGGITVAFSPLNSLGQQTAQEWGLPHIHDYGTDRDSQTALKADVSAHGGIVACINSAHRVRQLIPSDRPLLLIIDEAAQTLTDAAEGGTLSGEWADRWEDAIALLRQAVATGAIALAEDGLDAATLQLAKTLSGGDRSIVIQHQKQAAPWQVQISRAPISAWRSALLSAAEAQGPQLIVTTSQKEARRLEKILRDAGLDTVRVDSQTNEGGRFRAFFEAPDRWLQERQPQVLILSPSCKTGLSIQGNIAAEAAYFKAVWGYFPALDTDTQLQLLGRYRPNVPRYIWAPAFIQPEPGEKPNRLAIADELSTEAARYVRAAGFGQPQSDPDDAAIKQYLAARRSRRWAGKVAPVEALQERLAAAGHAVTVVTEGSPDPEIAELWQITDRLIAEEDSQHRAGLAVNPEIHDLSWANQVLRSVDSSHESRCIAAKVKMLARFPGLDWNDPQLWFDAVFCPATNRQRPAAPGAALWAEAEHYRDLWAEDTAIAREILGKRLRAAHLLPQSGPKAAIAALFRPLVEQLLKSGEVVPCAPTEEIKLLALQHRDDIRRYWRLEIKPEQSAIAIACKIARKFGLTTERSRRVTVGDRQVWVYSVLTSATWRSLVAARKFALEADSPNPLNLVLDLINRSINGFGLPPESPPPALGEERDRPRLIGPKNRPTNPRNHQIWA